MILIEYSCHKDKNVVLKSHATQKPLIIFIRQSDIDFVLKQLEIWCKLRLVKYNSYSNNQIHSNVAFYCLICG